MFQLPSSGDLWSIHVDFDTKRLDPWERIIPTFKYSRDIPFFEMLVPTADTVRYGYLMEKLLAVKHSVLFTGTTGVGKVGNWYQMISATKSEGTVELGSSAMEITHFSPGEIWFSDCITFPGRIYHCRIYIDPGISPKVYQLLNISSGGCHQPGFEFKGISVLLQLSHVVWKETAHDNCVPQGLLMKVILSGLKYTLH